jgi:hypothetical protein
VVEDSTRVSRYLDYLVYSVSSYLTVKTIWIRRSVMQNDEKSFKVGDAAPPCHDWNLNPYLKDEILILEVL